MATCSLGKKHGNLSNKSGGKKTLMQTDGPGIWFTLHTMSLFATSRESARYLIYFIRKTLSNFKCLFCREHAANYMRKNPPELKMGKLFYWTVDFHNDVNHRKGKENWTYAHAYNFYHD